MPRATTEFDSPWKEVIEYYFPAFMEFFFPPESQLIDWSHGYEFLDNELTQVVREAKLGRRRVDKLVKVTALDGQTVRLYIHIEVQAQFDADFELRMFVYHYRLFDRYRQPIISLALLGDERAEWYPNGYSYEIGRCKMSFEFPCVKLLDYRKRWDELEHSRNPFAMIVRIHLKGLDTRKSPKQRLYWKKELLKAMYEANYQPADLLELFWFLDWIFALPTSLEQQFDKFITDYEEEKQMRYVTSIEQRGRQEGLQQGLQLGHLQQSQQRLLEVLQVRFQRLPKTLITTIQALDDLERLSQLFRQALVVESLGEFKQLLADLN